MRHLNPRCSVKELNLDRAKVTTAGLAQLKDYPKLTHLWLNRVPLDDAMLAQVKKCTSLIELHVPESGVGEAKVKELAKSLPGCRIAWDGGWIEPTKK